MRPYNDLSNLNQNGQPKVSEDAWAIQEQILEALDANLFLWPDAQPKPKNLAEAVTALLKEVRRLAEIVEAPKDFVTYVKDPEAYTPKDFIKWSCVGSVTSKDSALDCLSEHKAQKTDLVTAANATDLATAITLLNAIKAALNKMND